MVRLWKIDGKQHVIVVILWLTPYNCLLFFEFSLMELLWFYRAGQGKGVFLKVQTRRFPGLCPTLIQRLRSELDTWAIGARALAGEGTHFYIISGVCLKAIQEDCWFWGSDEELWGTAWAVDVFILQSIFHYFAILLRQQNRMPGDLNSGGGGTLRYDVLRVTTWDVLVCCHLLDRLLAKSHLVACGKAKSVWRSLMYLFGCVMVFTFRELNYGQRIHIFTAKTEPIAKKGPMSYCRGVPLEESCAHIGCTDHEPRFVRNYTYIGEMDKLLI